MINRMIVRTGSWEMLNETDGLAVGTSGAGTGVSDCGPGTGVSDCGPGEGDAKYARTGSRGRSSQATASIAARPRVELSTNRSRHRDTPAIG